ncbi:hypothetical protein SVIOM342S_04801 [Streptomyces violaceorubidus]
MVDLTAVDPDGSLEPDPDQVAEVPLIDLLDDAVDLTPGRHVEDSHRDFAVEYQTLRRELTEQVRLLAELLPALVAGEGPSSLDGPTVSVSDLARAGLVAYGDPEPVSTSDQLDTDYLQGFLRSAGNTRRSTSTSGTFRLDSKGARIPQSRIKRVAEQEEEPGDGHLGCDTHRHRASPSGCRYGHGPTSPPALNGQNPGVYGSGAASTTSEAARARPMASGRARRVARRVLDEFDGPHGSPRGRHARDSRSAGQPVPLLDVHALPVVVLF